MNEAENTLKQVVEYSVMQHTEIGPFLSTISTLLEEGWQPWGGVSTTCLRMNGAGLPDKNGNEVVHYAQAFVKYKES